MKLCVYCSASDRIDQKFKDLAGSVGKVMAEADIALVFGGGKHSMMGAVSKAVVDNGGRAIGFIPGHLEISEGGHSNIQEIHIVDSMHTRKLKMSETADAFLILPGGFGTLDEFFEIITWKQIAIHHKPIVIMNAFNYWDPLISLMNNIFDSNFARDDQREFVDVITSPEELVPLLKRHGRMGNLVFDQE